MIKQFDAGNQEDFQGLSKMAEAVLLLDEKRWLYLQS